MKNFLIFVGVVCLAGCMQVKNNHEVICKRLADGYLNTQLGNDHYLVQEPQSQGDTIHLLYRVQQSYKIIQTELKAFECVQKPETMLLSVLDNGVKKVVVILTLKK